MNLVAGWRFSVISPEMGDRYEQEKIHQGADRDSKQEQECLYHRRIHIGNAAFFSQILEDAVRI